MSDWSAVCDALLSDLQANVAALAAASVIEHKYAPWAPEELAADPGERHIAVWPVGGEEASTLAPFVTDGGQLATKLFRIAYWEHAGAETAKGQADEAAAAVMFDLENAVVARLHVKANFTLGGLVDDVRAVSTIFPEQSSISRWFVLTVRVLKAIPAT